MATTSFAPPTITIPPFNDANELPACAAACGPLYDANGACVPPAFPANEPSMMTDCFCNDARVAAFSTGSAGVCDEACTADASGLSSIAAWFQDICSVDANDAGNGNGVASTTSKGSSSTGTPKPAQSNGGGGDWLSNHWKWVVMLVILVVGIAGIWIGACIWRRRYLAKKDRQSTLGQKHSGSASRPSWGPGMSASELGQVGHDHSAYDSNRNSNAPIFPTTASAALNEKPPKKDKKRWIVKERT